MIRKVHPKSASRQKGVTTLAITLILLVIITLIVVFSTNVGFFEQKTATNENRARISQQAAEYALNLAGEYIKANRENLISNTVGSGWLATTGTSRRWAKCADVGAYPAGHPCTSERDLVRRAQLYFYTSDGTVGGTKELPYRSIIPDAAEVENGMGGASSYAATSNVSALLCRLDTSDPSNVQCKLEPTAGNRVALTLVADASLTNEGGAKGEVKATWASYSSFTPSASVPLIASGLVKGLGNGQIVANPDSRSDGSNVMASVWSPNNVTIGGGAPVGSFITCQFSEFTNQLFGGVEMSMYDVKTTCPTATGTSPPCNCPKAPDPNRTSKEDWSGHGTGGGSTVHKGNDILDVAGSETVCDPSVNTIVNGCRTLPSITFFPGPNAGGSAMDKVGVLNDDSLFEFIFGVDYVVPDRSTDGHTLTNCGSSGTQNCVDYAMREEFNAEVISDCSAANLNSSSSGIYYVTGPCASISQQVGSPDAPAIVVINQGGDAFKLLNGALIYGMLFIHADEQNADVGSQGKAQVYGALVVEGDIDMAGNFTIVYDSTSSATNTHKIPKSAKFGLVPGSWLDAKTSF